MESPSARSVSAIPPKARCLGCGYSLYQLAGDRCPECGRAFDREDLRSMNLADPLSWRIARAFDRPTTRETRLRPLLATLFLFVSALVPYGYGISILLSAELWIFFAARHLPAMAARQFLFSKNLVIKQSLRDDRRLLFRSTICLLISIVWLIFPVQGYIVFALFHSDLDRLAAHVPGNLVTYVEFGRFRVGPFKPNAIARCPHWLDIGIGWAGVEQNRTQMPYPCGTVFKLEDDPAYVYDNSQLWHLKGRWYVQYRP